MRELTTVEVEIVSGAGWKKDALKWFWRGFKAGFGVKTAHAPGPGDL